MTDPQTPPAPAEKGNENQPGSGAGAAPAAGSFTIPEKFKGKSPEEISRAYVELETEMGKQSNTVKEARELQEKTNTLLQAIWDDPELYKNVEAGIKKFTGKGIKPPADKKPEDGKPTGGEDPSVTDLRTFGENQVIGDFYKKFGYFNLADEARKDASKKLAVTLANLVDPGGTKSFKEIIKSIPITKLPQYLENAHWIANRESIIKGERERSVNALSEEENRSGAIGSFVASGGKSDDSVVLTQKERETAAKMGISPEKYAKRKAEMLKENKRYG